MQRRARLNLLLLVAVLATAWVVWRDVTTPKPVPRSERLTDIDPATARRLTVVRESNGQILEFMRASGRWWLMRDQRLPADETRVGEVLRLADATSEAAYDLDAVDRREVGLDPPRARVVIDGTELRIGAQEPLRYRRYVASSGRLHLVADTAYVHLGADWTAFVDPSPLAGHPAVVGISAPRWMIERVGGDAWDVTQGPADTPASDRAGAWRQLVAEVVREDGIPAEGAITLVFNFEGGAKRQLRAWRTGTTWWLAWDDGPVRYGIPAARAGQLGLD